MDSAWHQVLDHRLPARLCAGKAWLGVPHLQHGIEGST